MLLSISISYLKSSFLNNYFETSFIWIFENVSLIDILVAALIDDLNSFITIVDHYPLCFEADMNPVRCC